MNRQEFDILLQKYLAGECSDEEARHVSLLSYNMLAHDGLFLSRSEKIRLKKRLWGRLSKDVLGRRVFWRSIFFSYRGIAASLLLVVLASGTLFFYDKKERVITKKNTPFAAANGLATVAQEGIITFRSEGKPKTLTLEDGSTITLEKESSISYPAKFDADVRQVHLEGAAFFNVKRDTGKPFLVYSGGLVTKVLGTSFNVRSSAATGKVEVEVVSGSVSVYENTERKLRDAEKVILTPNQRMIFEMSSRKIVTELVDEPETSSLPEESAGFIFDKKPLTEVLSELSEAFEVAITIDSPALLPCVFTGDLSGLPLHTQLQFICSSVNGSYELKGNVYSLKGEGCTP